MSQPYPPRRPRRVGGVDEPTAEIPRYRPDPPAAPPAARKRRRWPWVVGGLVGLVVVGSAIGGNRDAPAPAASPTAPGAPAELPAELPAVQPPAPAEPAPLRIGDTVDVDGLALTVAKLRDGDDTFGATSCVTVTYLNNSADEQTFNTFDWELRDTQGVEVTSGFFGSDNALGSGNLRPGGTKTGDVCFDVQGSGSPESVVYTGSLFGGREDIVWLTG